MLMTNPTVCGNGNELQKDDNVRKSIELTEAQRGLSRSSNDFTFDFMKILAGKEKDDANIFASPFSLRTVLSMTAEGAAGDTKDEMRRALKLSEFSEEDATGYFKTIIPALQGADKTTVMEIANSFWSKKAIPIKKDYVAMLKADYYAECETLADNGIAAAGAVNSWCGRKTHGMINMIVDQIPDDQMVALINALYFKGEWSSPFNKDYNYDDDFHNYDGSTKKVTLMKKETSMNVYRGKQAAAINLPYGNEAFQMTVILPNEGVNVDDVVAGLDAESWRRYRNYGERHPVTVSFPKFESEYSASANCIETLKDMGMEKAFTRGADFSGISDVSVFIDQVIHKAKVKVNEEGTEAAAVSYVGMRLGSAAVPLEHVYFKVDRPFIYAISEISTGTIVFMGIQKQF
ncbi:MAG: serpin family protein [Bacteroidales bacterium]|nr:serpin family protein [Bacteroidales bacterium]